MSGALAWCSLLDTAFARHNFEARKEFILAVKTAVRIVLYVVRIIELLRLDVFVAETPLTGECLGGVFVRLGDGSGVRRDRQGVFAQNVMCRPRQIS
jgi:hypothetical protein